MKAELYEIMKEEGLAHLTFTSKQIRERVAKAKIVKAVRFHLKRIRERKLYQAHVLRIQKIVRARNERVKRYINAFQLEKYPKILILKEQRRLFFVLLEETVNKMKIEFSLKKYQEWLKTSEEFDTLRYWYPSNKVLRSPVPIFNIWMPAYLSKIRYSVNKEKFNKETSIFQKYGSFIRKSENSDRVLKILKPQFGHHRKIEITNYTEKIRKEQEKNMGSIFDDYKDFLEFSPNDNILLARLIREVWLYNKSVSVDDEPLGIFMPIEIHRIASAIKIQSVFRGYLFRKRINHENGPSFNDRIVERRAVIYIQRWWQWYKIRERINALTNIKQYVSKIDSENLYLEENLYKNLNKIVMECSFVTRFPEQLFQFDFNPGFEACIKQRDWDYLNISKRFENNAIPVWMNLQLSSEFYNDNTKTEYNSNIMALLHYVKSSLSIIDNKSCIKGKEHTVRFIKCGFESIQESKQRALIVALLTYRLSKKLFIPFYTDEMMKKPLILMNLRNLWSVYRTHDWRENINHLEKKRILDEEMYTFHSGLIISAEDQYLASSQPYIKIRVKTQKGSYGEPEEIVEVEKDIIITSTKQEVNSLKQEALQKERDLEEAKNKKAFEVRNKIKELGKRKDPAEIHIVKSSGMAIEKVDISNMTTRLNSELNSDGILSPLRVEGEFNKTESMASETKSNRMSRLFPNSYNEEYFKYTTAKERARDMHLMRAEIEERKREEIIKIREINKLMKSMGKEEHENNIKLFQKYNEDERQIVNALIKKAKEKEINEKITKRLQIIKNSRRKDIIKSEMNFALNFSRQKNLIEKYEQAGEKSKRVRKDKIEMLGRVKTLRTYKSDKPKVQLSTQLFDTSFVEEKPSKDMSSLNYQATMDTNRTEVLTNIVKPFIQSLPHEIGKISVVKKIWCNFRSFFIWIITKTKNLYLIVYNV